MSLEARKTAPMPHAEKSPLKKRRKSQHDRPAAANRGKAHMDTGTEVIATVIDTGKDKGEPQPGPCRDTAGPAADRPPIAPLKSRRKSHSPCEKTDKHSRRKSKSPANKLGDQLNISAGELMVSDVRRKSRRQSKRRSSFVAGRITKSLPTSSAGELFTTIPVELEEHTRLEMLSRRAMEFTLNKVREEFPHLPDFEQFRIRALEAANRTVDGLREEGLFEQMVRQQTDSHSVNASETAAECDQIQAYIDTALHEINRYENESQEWDRLLQQFHTQAEKAQLRHEEEAAVIITAPPSGLSKKQRAFIDSTPNYSDHVTRLEHNKQTTQLSGSAMKEIIALYGELAAVSRVARQHERLFAEAKATAAQYARLIHEMAFPNSRQQDLFKPCE